MINPNVQWASLLYKILELGSTVSPRGSTTRELIGNKTVIDMSNPMVTVKSRNVSYEFMFAEAWWILAGRNDVESIKPYAPSIANYSDNGVTFRGAYGPAVISQLDYVVDTLVQDEFSRQALLTIWNRNPGPSKDIPCTVSLQFLIRKGEIHCIANMRSSDAWIGYIYDTFNFSCISLYVAAEYFRLTGKKLGLGELTLNAGSQHLYENTFDKAKVCIENREDVLDEFSENILSLFDGYPKSGQEVVNRLFKLKDDPKAWMIIR